jgi:hypothetical protein
MSLWCMCWQQLCPLLTLGAAAQAALMASTRVTAFTPGASLKWCRSRTKPSNQV